MMRPLMGPEATKHRLRRARTDLTVQDAHQWPDTPTINAWENERANGSPLAHERVSPLLRELSQSRSSQHPEEGR